MPYVPLVFVKLDAATVAVKCFVSAKICVVRVTLVSVFFQKTQAGKFLLAGAAEVRSRSSPKQIAHLKNLAETRKCYQQPGKAAELVAFDQEAQVATEEDGQRRIASVEAHAIGAGRRGAKRGPDEGQALIAKRLDSLLENQGQGLVKDGVADLKRVVSQAEVAKLEGLVEAPGWWHPSDLKSIKGNVLVV